MSESTKKGLNTPYDSSFKSIIRKCPRLALFLINEMFFKTGLIDEEYDGSERTAFLDKELPDTEHNSLEMDIRLVVYKSRRRTFHLECQSTTDGTLILRKIQYDTRSALEEAGYTASSIRVKLDDSGIMFLRSNNNTPDIMTVVLEVPHGKSVSYQIPIVKMHDYPLNIIIDRKLFVLLPFLFFNYEKHLSGMSEDASLYGEVLHLYNAILDKLKELVDSGIINSYEANTLYDALKTVFEALGKTHKSEQEVSKIMGGEILEFSADKIFNAGKAEGLTEGISKGRDEGRTEGRAEGRAEGEQKLANLLNVLFANGEREEAALALKDQAYRDLLYKKYSIV